MDRKEGVSPAVSETVSAECKSRFGKTLESVKTQLLEQIRLRTTSINKIPYTRDLIYLTIKGPTPRDRIRREMSFNEILVGFDSIVYPLAERAEALFRTSELTIEAHIFPYEKEQDCLVKPVRLLGTGEAIAATEVNTMARETREEVAEKAPESIRPAASSRPMMRSSHSFRPPAMSPSRPKMLSVPGGLESPVEKPWLDFSELEKLLTAEFLDQSIIYNFANWNLLITSSSLQRIRSILKINKINTPRDLLRFLGTLNPTEREWNALIDRLNDGGRVNDLQMGDGSSRYLLNWARRQRLIPAEFRN